MAASATADPDWRRVSTAPTPYTVFTKLIEKSPQDDRDYRLIELDNGLRAMLVHDAKTDKAAASLNVAVGHLNDPDDMPGLAHFCEHLLFMGTEQYPGENEYQEFLTKNNGYSNAFTGASNTNYYFSVSTNALPGALSRFAAFFHCPLFAPSCTSRELNAVDSEHKKNQQSDSWRISQVNKHLSKEGHAWRKFGTGNKESLSKVGRELKARGLLGSNGNGNGHTNGPVSGVIKSADGSFAPPPASSLVPSSVPSVNSTSSELEGDGGVVGRETRRRLVEWWSKEYCAGRMRLCIIGKESLDDMADMVAKLFSPVKNRGQVPLPMIIEHPFGPNEIGTMVSVQTIMSFYVLDVLFPLDYQHRHWRYEPGGFLAHFLGHEGPGSLHSYLKNKGWITTLDAGPQNLGRGFAMMKVTLQLTKEGFENYRAGMLAVFKYLSLLRSSSFPAWYQRELSTICATRFRFAEKYSPDNYAIRVTQMLAYPVPPERILSAPQLVEEWDEHDPANSGEHEVHETLEGLRVGKGRVVLMAKVDEHERVRGNVAEWETEPWYGTSYRVEKLDADFLAQAESPNDIPELYLPGPNKFIPTNMNVEKCLVDKPLRRPRLIRETPLSSLWYKKDDYFLVPKAQVMLAIRSPLANASARTATLTHLFAELVNDSLTEIVYDANLAGLSYYLVGHTDGLCLILWGYNDKLHVLARNVLEHANNLHIKADRLAVMKEQLKRGLENYFLNGPCGLSDDFGCYLMQERKWTMEEILAEIPSVTVEEVQAQMSGLLSKINMRMLLLGNMSKDEAVRLMEMAENTLQASPISIPEVLDRTLIFPNASNYVWSRLVPNPNEPNSCLAYYTRVGSALEPRTRVTLALLAQILSEPAFNVLRTREQLGYNVSCSQWASPGDSEIGLRILIQSERDPVYLEERVEAFLDEMKEKLFKTDEIEFEEQKTGLEHAAREAAKNQAEETEGHWRQIRSGYLDFLRCDNDADLVKTITKEDVISMFLSRIHPSSSSRAKLSVHLRSQKPPAQKISNSAMEAFESLVTARGITVDGQRWRSELTGNGEPLVSHFERYWQATLAGEPAVTPEVGKEIMASLPALLEQHPAPTESKGKIKDGVVFIEDPKAFRASLKVSALPKPLVDWGDLPTSIQS
ncbi:insulin-degrading enzyme [Amylocystis lapponica]|nr:insulin-degrading enzyme [Amylocystis lapponica]